MLRGSGVRLGPRASLDRPGLSGVLSPNCLPCGPDSRGAVRGWSGPDRRLDWVTLDPGRASSPNAVREGSRTRERGPPAHRWGVEELGPARSGRRHDDVAPARQQARRRRGVRARTRSTADLNLGGTAGAATIRAAAGRHPGSGRARWWRCRSSRSESRRRTAAEALVPRPAHGARRTRR